MKAFLLFQLKLGLSALMVTGVLLLFGVPTHWACLLGFAYYDLQTILAMGRVPERRKPRLRAVKLRPLRQYLN